MKARGDWAFCEGINHFVLHVYIHQPWEDRQPGVNAWFGTEFNRHNTWFNASQDWISYLRRCCFLLQQGTRVADVAYFIGEDAPKMTGIRQPELPPGFDYDYINAEVIQTRLTVKDGLLTLPGGPAYRVLVLPELSTMRPATGPQNPRPGIGRRDGAWPAAAAFAEHAGLSGLRPRSARSGRGGLGSEPDRGNTHRSTRPLFVSAVTQDFSSTAPLLYTHRTTGDTEIYFVANQQPQEVVATATFRVQGMVPELWRPESGRVERAAVYDVAEGMVRVPLHLNPHGSVFVVFRREAPGADRIVAVRHDGETILDAKTASSRDPASTPGAAADVHDTFTLAVWAKPAADTTLHKEANEGANALSEPRNDAIFPPHGNAFGAGTHAGSGLAIGRNGLCVLEHGAAYFAPVLVHAVPLEDWTHIAVVYRDAQPSLYLNGVLVHTGLKSMYTVHPGTATGDAGGSFVGGLGGVEVVPRALEAAEVKALMQSMLRPGVRPPGSAAGTVAKSRRARRVPGVAARRVRTGACRWTRTCRPSRRDSGPAAHHGSVGSAVRSALGWTPAGRLRGTGRLDAAPRGRHPALLRHGHLPQDDFAAGSKERTTTLARFGSGVRSGRRPPQRPVARHALARAVARGDHTRCSPG